MASVAELKEQLRQAELAAAQEAKPHIKDVVDAMGDPAITDLLAKAQASFDALPEGSMSKRQMNNILTVFLHSKITMEAELTRIDAMAAAETPAT